MLVTATVNETKLPLKQQCAMVLGTVLVQTFQSLLRKNVTSLMLGELKKKGTSLLKEKFPAIVFICSVSLRTLGIAEMF